MYNIFMLNDDDHFNTLRKIEKTPQSTQRALANELGFSLEYLNLFIEILSLNDS